MTRGEDRFVVGVDEAGYGPLLGPLTVGCVRIDGPAEALPRALRSGRRGLPRVADSKRVYAGRSGLAALERTALAAVAAARGEIPRSLAEFLGDVPAGWADHPWYGDGASRLPLAASVDEVATAAAALARGLAEEEARLATAHVDVHLEQVYNARCRRHGNKGAAHWEHVAAAFSRGLAGATGDGRVDCDRLGGRKEYASLLLGLFPFRPTTTLAETPDESRYDVDVDGARRSVAFLTGGETRSPAIALASCLAKYAREALMTAFNAHFAARAPGLAPTAGYWEDGLRFLADLVAATGDEGWRSRLARER